MVIAHDVEPAVEAIAAEMAGALDLDSDVSPTDDLCSLERLPKELMWKVIERVPEAVLELRKTSATLKSLVENFALAQSTMPLVSKISFGAFRLPGSTKKPEIVDVNFDIDEDKVDLFYLRLQMLGQTKFKEEIMEMRANPEVDPIVKKRDKFDITFDASDEGCMQKLEQFREYLGRRIGKVQFSGIHEPVTLPYITRVLEHTQFSKMKVVSDKLPEECALHMLQTMVAHNVKELSLSGKFETTIDTVTLLRQLASHLRGLQIFQTPMDAGSEITQSHLFGTDNVDWGSLIVELLSGELDKLNINNPTYSGYLNGSATDKIIDILPKLNKKVHFVATCDQYSEGLTSDSHKNYAVKVNPPPPAPAGNNQAPAKPKQFLQIKHVERENEPVVDTFTLDIECK